ncbi:MULTISPECIES: hypothetical protein [Bacillus]|nr:MULTISPECIES: hypothetical protein [Bacillus]MDU0071831.1 hypothetical protein [Bacillus sp. IG6]MED8019456.1 hypothetical protein [Bacillus glycinifermentans]WKB77048.1 hypothetical protein QYM22_22360 [Bacillus glycinifermentans]
MILNTQLCCGLYENGGKQAGFARVIFGLCQVRLGLQRLYLAVHRGSFG